MGSNAPADPPVGPVKACDVEEFGCESVEQLFGLTNVGDACKSRLQKERSVIVVVNMEDFQQVELVQLTKVKQFDLPLN